MPLFDRIRSNDGQPIFLLDVDVEQRDDAVASLLRYQLERPDALASVELQDAHIAVKVVPYRDGGRRLNLYRCLNALWRDGITTVRGFVWTDAITNPKDRWLDETLLMLSPRGNQVEGGLRVARFTGVELMERLVQRLDDDQFDLWKLASAINRTGLNTHSTEAGELLIPLGLRFASSDSYASSVFLDGARDIAKLERFGIRTEIDDQLLLELLPRKNWYRAAEIAAALRPPRSDSVVDELLRAAETIVDGKKSTEIAAESAVNALMTADDDRADVDAMLERFVGHASSTVRGHTAYLLAKRRPERARSLWEPWLSSRSFNERHAAELLLTGYGDERDIAEVVRIAKHRSKPLKGTTYWPPLAADQIEFLVRYSDQPEAAQALEWLTNRWDKLDDDLQRWLRENQPHLVPDAIAESDVP